MIKTNRLMLGIALTITMALPTFSGHAADVGFAAGRAIKGDVAHDNILFGNEGGIGWRIDNDFSAGKAFADIIIRVAFKVEGHTLWHEGTEALPGISKPTLTF